MTDSINNYLATSTFAEKAFDIVSSEKEELISELSKKAYTLNIIANKFLNSSTSATLSIFADKAFNFAVERFKEKTNAEAEIQRLKSEIEAVQTLMSNLKSKSAELSVDDIFYSDEVTRELFRIFIQKIIVDEKSDDIEIVFNTNIYNKLG